MHIVLLILICIMTGTLYAEEPKSALTESTSVESNPAEHNTKADESHSSKTATSETHSSTSGTSEHSEGHENKGQGGLLEALGIDFRVLFIQLVGFILLIIVLKKFLFAPVMKALDDRREGIKNTLDKVENDRIEMEKMKNDYEQRLSQVEAEARERIQKAVKEAQQIGEDIVNEKREEADKLIEKAKSEIEREKEKSLFELREEVSKLSLELAGKIIHRELSPQVHHDLIQNFINSIGQESRN